VNIYLSVGVCPRENREKALFTFFAESGCYGRSHENFVRNDRSLVSCLHAGIKPTPRSAYSSSRAAHIL
jgi:hypothetical protein